MKKILALVTVMLLGVSIYAEDITGTYDVIGSNPGGQGRYKGTVIITKTGQTYKIVWSVGSAYTGTGILTGNVLSVAYTDISKKWFGIVSYQVSEDGKKLTGKWCPHGGKNLGTETLTKK